MCNTNANYLTVRLRLHGTGRLRNRTKICTVPPVYTELDDFGTVPKFVRFHAPVYAVPDDFGTGPKFVRFTCLHGTDELESG